MKLSIGSCIFILAVGCSGKTGTNTTSGGAGSVAGGGSTASAGGGSTASAGGGSTSSAGGGSTHARFNFINASPDQLTGVDACVAGSNGIYVRAATNIAFGHASAFADVSNDASASVRVVATGADCATLTPLATVTLPNLSNSTAIFTLVLFSQSDGTPNVSLLSQFAPAAGNTFVTLMNALKTADATVVSLAVPFTPLLSTGVGEAAGANFAPLASNVLLVNTYSGVTPVASYEFPTFSTAPNVRVTAVILGEAGASGPIAPKLLVCDDSTTTPTCTTIDSRATAFVRVANLSDASQGGAVHFWATIDGGTSFSAVDTLPYATVGSYFSVPSGSVTVCVTTTATAPTALPCSGAIASLSVIFSEESYQTVALGGATGSETMVAINASPIIADPANVLVSSLHLIAGAPTPVTVSSPALFGTPITENAARATVSTFTVPAAQWFQIQASDIDLTTSTQFAALAVSLDFTPLASFGAVTALYGGAITSPYALFCTNDGTLDVDGYSRCSVAALVSATEPAYVRVASLSAASGVLDLCAVASGTPILSNVGEPALTRFVAVPAGTTILYSGASCNQPLPVSALAAGVYYTLELVGDVSVAYVRDQDPPPPLAQNQALITTYHGWHGTGADPVTNTLAFSFNATSIGGALAYATYSGTYLSIAPGTLIGATLSVVNSAAPSVPLTYTIPDTVPAFGGGIYSARAVSDPAGIVLGAPLILWCADNLLEATSATLDACVLLSPNP